ncbi:AI-2E family transporter (plasmid) [Legionella lytica]|uniref:AI-2E family transporter n=2 Tax=Legionella lytica TaxID=96232 RepID=A0ABY4YCT6_9GAMM|nr:AI-2E family transporter [Legionella lytica]
MTFMTKYFYTLGSLLFTGYLLVISRSLFNPLLAAFIIALALRPFATKLEYIKIPRLGSTLISVMLFLLVFLGLAIFFSSQIRNIDFEMQSFGGAFTGLAGKIQNWLVELLGIGLEQQVALLKDALNALLKNSVSFMNSTLQTTTNFITSFVIFIISLFFILYYRAFLVSFLYKTIKSLHHAKLTKTLNMIQEVVSSYVLGVLFVILIVATLNILGLFALGIPNAIFFGVMAAVLTLIPYIGILLGALLPMFFALFTKDSFWYPIGVLLVFMLVQFFEGNFLTPNIVGRQVSINPFAAILGLIVGGMLLGFTGIMFALPVLAIIKVVCDNISGLKQMGYLIGNPPP